MRVVERLCSWWAWRPTRRALRRFDDPARGRLSARAEALVHELLRQGISARATLRRGIPAAARLLPARRLAAVLALASRLAWRRIDPAPILSQGLGAAAGAAPEDFSPHLCALERLAVRLAAELHLDWRTLEPQFPALAREAADYQRAGGDYVLRLVPGRGRSFWVAGTVPGFEAPFVIQELYWTDTPQEVYLVTAPRRSRRRTSV